MEAASDNAQSLMFMQKISSNGNVYVSDFKGLNDLKETILSEISCGAVKKVNTLELSSEHVFN